MCNYGTAFVVIAILLAFLIFLQVLWFVGLFLKFTSYSQYITAAFKILSILETCCTAVYLP